MGYGWAATAHIDAINATEVAQVSAICSSRKQDPVELSSRHGSQIKVYTEFDEMLADTELQVIDITGYPSKHAEQAIKVAEAKKHLILEKPMANSLEEVRAIVKSADENGILGCVCFECRFSSQFLATKAVLDEGLLGDLHYGEVDYYHGIGPWYGQFRWNVKKKDGGSALLTAGCHALDALLHCMGSEVESVSSFSSKSKSEIFEPYEYNTTSVTILKFKNGSTGKCASVVDCLQPYYFHTHLVGSKGSLLDDKYHSSKLKTNKNEWSRLSMKMLDSGDVSDHPYQTQFEAFFESLKESKPMPFTNLNESLKSFEVIFAADLSASDGGRLVSLEELK